MNGTFLNGKKLATACSRPIKDGDELTLCRLVLNFKASTRAPADRGRERRRVRNPASSASSALRGPAISLADGLVVAGQQPLVAALVEGQQRHAVDGGLVPGGGEQVVEGGGQVRVGERRSRRRAARSGRRW